jgi:hypothetical protein
MSAPEQHTTGECERVLDYAYDELTGEAKLAFEQHLAGCAKCQRELAALKRVRGAVKAVLPTVDPPANATGALHAQLLHAAAQRKPMGKLLPFGRRVQRVMMHPGVMAAAALVVVVTVGGTMWWRDKVMMPARSEAPAVAAPTVATTPAPVTVTTELPPAAEPKPTDELKGNEGGAAANGEPAKKTGSPKSDSLYLNVGKDAPPMAVTRAPAHASMPKKEQAPAEKPAMLAAPKERKMPAQMKNSADGLFDSGGEGNLRRRNVPAGRAAAASDEPLGGLAGGAGDKTAPTKVLDQPTTIPQAATSAPAREESAETGVNVDGKLSGPRSSTSGSTWRGTVENKKGKKAVPKPAAPVATPQAAPPPPPAEMESQKATQAAQRPSNEVLRKQANAFADENRCEEAVKLFEQLQKSRWKLTSAENKKLANCRLSFMRDKQLDNSMQRMDDIEASKPAPQMKANEPMAEQPVAASPPPSPSRAPAKAKKKAAPADAAKPAF